MQLGRVRRRNDKFFMPDAVKDVPGGDQQKSPPMVKQRSCSDLIDLVGRKLVKQGHCYPGCISLHGHHDLLIFVVHIRIASRIH
jgi:hypothetical protein